MTTSCRSVVVEPVHLEYNGFKCVSELKVDETKDFLDQLSLLRVSLYEQLSLTPRNIEDTPILHIFTNRKRYKAAAEQSGVPGEYTDGFCDVEKLELYLYLKSSLFGGYKNRSTLYHEFTHLCLCSKLIYDSDNQPLQKMPFWFAEGMATYVETVRFDGDSVIWGSVNSKRLKLLRPYINQRIVLIDPLIKREYNDGFSLNHYAIAWGLVYYMMNTPEHKSGVKRFVNEFPTTKHNEPFVVFKSYFLQGDENYAQWESRFINYINNL